MADHGQRAEREPKWGSGGGAPAGFKGGQMGGSKAFCQFSCKKWPKVTDLSENLPLSLRQTASLSHDQP